MENSSSSASISDRPAWPSTWPGEETRHPKAGDVPSQSCRRHRRDGSVRRTDNLVSSALRLLIVGHGRRQILWFGVTARPTAERIANQITEACGWEQAPRYLIRDRDGAYGEIFIRRLRSMGIRDRPTTTFVVFSERHLRHLLLSYMKYYNAARTHLSLEKDAPVSRAVDRAGHILCRPHPGRTVSSICRI